MWRAKIHARQKRTSQYRLRLAAEVSSLMRWSRSTAIYAAGAHHAAAVILCLMDMTALPMQSQVSTHCQRASLGKFTAAVIRHAQLAVGFMTGNVQTALA